MPAVPKPEPKGKGKKETKTPQPTKSTAAPLAAPAPTKTKKADAFDREGALRQVGRLGMKFRKGELTAMNINPVFQDLCKQASKNGGGKFADQIVESFETASKQKGALKLKNGIPYLPGGPEPTATYVKKKAPATKRQKYEADPRAVELF